MPENTGSRALGNGQRRTTASTIAVLGFVFAIVGSAGPWVANTVASSGFQFQGKVTAGIAAFGIVLVLFGRSALKLVMLAAIGELALAGYEYVHLHNTFGWVVGWGVYSVIGGAVLAAAGAASAFAERGI